MGRDIGLVGSGIISEDPASGCLALLPAQGYDAHDEMHERDRNENAVAQRNSFKFHGIDTSFPRC